MPADRVALLYFGSLNTYENRFRAVHSVSLDEEEIAIYCSRYACGTHRANPSR